MPPLVPPYVRYLLCALLLLPLACKEEVSTSEETARPCLGDPCFDPRLAPQTNSRYEGARFGVARNQGTSRHEGLDLAMEPGTPLYAMYDSYIYKVGRDERGWGNYIICLTTVHGEQVFIMYAHLRRATVPAGAFVKAGDMVALSGESGNLREARDQGFVGSHMHMEVRRMHGFSEFKLLEALDPEEFMSTELTYSGRPKYDRPCHSR